MSEKLFDRLPAWLTEAGLRPNNTPLSQNKDPVRGSINFAQGRLATAPVRR